MGAGGAANVCVCVCVFAGGWGSSKHINDACRQSLDYTGLRDLRSNFTFKPTSGTKQTLS